MVRSFLLVFISFLFPLLLFGQEDGKPVKDTAEKKDASSYKNEVGVGVHTVSFLRHIWWNPHSDQYLLQGSYKRNLEYFTLRGGAGIGKQYLYRSRNYEEGWTGASLLILNLGIEKTIWRIGDRFQMRFGLDLVHRRSWTEYPPGEFRADGLGVTWMNSYRFAPRSSVSLELGMAYGKYGWNKRRGFYWQDREWGFIPPLRNLVISYNYHF